MAKAIHKNANISAQKARLIVDMIRGSSIEDASNILNFQKKKGAKLVKKVLESAVANAEHNDGADIDELFVSKAYVDQGMKLKRMSPRAKGRGDIIKLSFSNITVEVAEKEDK